MVAQSILRRPIRTLLTIGAISLTIGAIVALQAIIGGAKNELSNIAGGGGGEIMLRQANASDTSQSVIDVRVGERIEALPQVESVDGLTFAATALPETTFFILFGYDPNGRAIQQFKIIAGGPLQTNRQIIIGDAAARALNKGPGDSLDLAGSRFKIVGVYESSMGFANIGGVVTLRDGQSFLGRPRQATMMSVSLVDPSQAAEVVALINERFPEVHASLNGDFVESLPDFEATNAMMSAISVMAILVGGVGIMNTMLMAVMERTREIGALRALGWRRRGVLSLILREALLLGLIGGAVGVALAFGLTLLIALSPFAGEAVAPVWNVGIFVQALTVSLLLGAIGGVYPAFRATRMQPVEALRYE
jgi:putative ABC transport system permease protein